MSGLTIDQLLSTATPDDFAAKIKAACTIVGLAPGSWLASGITVTLINVAGTFLGVPSGSTLDPSLSAKGIDGLATSIAASGFLDEATKISPDPPTQQEDGSFNSPLDLLADSEYDEQRTSATFAAGPVTLTNSSGAQRGPFEVGTFHLVNLSKKKTYSNSEVLTLTPSADTTVGFKADEIGSDSNTVANALTLATSLIGVVVKTSGGANANSLIGIDAESNADLIIAARGRLQSLGPKLGPHGAYIYFAKARTTFGYPTLAGGAVTRVVCFTDPLTGIIYVYLADNAGPISGPDALLLKAFLTATVLPDGPTLEVSAAVPNNIAFTVDAYVPASKIAVAASEIQTAITDFVNTLPIGGTSGLVQGVQLAAVDAAIFKAVPYLNNLENLQMDGAAIDVALLSSQVAVASPTPAVTVHSTG
jgi:hypothetical protein